MKRFLLSFKYAFRGLISAIKTERNMRIHLCFCVFVTFFGFVCKITLSEWLAVLAFMALVISAEMHNTAIESALDRIGREHSELTKRSKDTAAGGVLAAAIISAFGGGIIFFRRARIEAALNFFSDNLWALIPFIAAVIGAILFIVIPWRNKEKK